METVNGRVVGAIEHGWCRALPGGTGITVVALLLSKSLDLQILQTALQNLQNYHPILGSKLHLDPSTRTFSFVTPKPNLSSLNIKSFDLQSTLKIIHDSSTKSLSSFQKIIEHEMNLNPWGKTDRGRRSHLSSDGSDLFQATVYELEGERWVVALKAHNAVCDRTAAAVLMRELLRLMNINGTSGAELESQCKGDVKLGIEEYIPSGMRKKSLWARGVNMLGYSLNSFRLSNIDFVDPRSPRCSQLIRLSLERDETTRLLEGCKNREIKLCGALTAAALMAARLCKHTPEGQREKYSVATLIDCRPCLEPPLTTHDFGFYYSAIVNTHDVNGREELWNLAKRVYKSFKDAKDGNKHLSDMVDLNFLMCKAIENPGLTPSSSLRTSFISVFEDPTLFKTVEDYEEIGVEDYMVCSGVHGIGPSLGVFNAIRDGRLDCTCIYPAPLHSREQMLELLDHIKKILVNASYTSAADDDRKLV